MKKSDILSDHMQAGKKLIPPFKHILTGTLSEISWSKIIIPQIIWTALLNDRFGYQEGAKLSLNLCKSLKDLKNPTREGPISSINYFFTFENMKDANELPNIDSSEIEKISECLGAFKYFYPKFPLPFKRELATDEKVTELDKIKKVLSNLLDRTSKEATFAQGNIVYMAFILENFKVFQGLALANFPELEKYPRTEESLRVAASTRATVTLFFGINLSSYSMTKKWPDYFWNRGLKISECE